MARKQQLDGSKNVRILAEVEALAQVGLIGRAGMLLKALRRHCPVRPEEV